MEVFGGGEGLDEFWFKYHFEYIDEDNGAGQEKRNVTDIINESNRAIALPENISHSKRDRNPTKTADKIVVRKFSKIVFKWAGHNHGCNREGPS